MDEKNSLKYLTSSKRIGNFTPGCGKNRLIGADIKILGLSFLMILIPSVWFVFYQLPLYEGFYKCFAVEVVFIASMLVDLLTLVDVGTTDSGIIPRATLKVNRNYNYYIEPRNPEGSLIKLKICKTCHILRPPRSFHCKKCGTCIEVHDHHCPFTGTCIGRRNHIKFIRFLFATFSHGVFAALLGIYPLWLKYNKPITNMYKFTSVILMGYSLVIMTLMFFFGMFHVHLSITNVTTNEKLRGSYKKKTNPWDLGTKRNWHEKTEVNPATPSSIFDNLRSLMEDEEQFYHSILSRYGTLVCQKVSLSKSDNTSDSENEFIEYNNHGLIKMMQSEEMINIESIDDAV
ncbi:unnamed protein product [Moneuplotes crassus]|uniref:Palmitoyltransferase n=1 Tax=Euplotes crassus TaxID=5936 RepID=A0AAD1XLV2_EUPCR|nr:unnamed protein product [Moneuplotes crassus]